MSNRNPSPVECVDCGVVLRPSDSSRRCNSCQWARTPRIPCSVCGKPTGWPLRSDRDPDQAQCRPCRRETQAKRKAEKAALVVSRNLPDWCLDCGAPKKTKHHWRCEPCRAERERVRQRNRVSWKRLGRQKDYGPKHQAERLARLREFTPGDPCARCGDPMTGPLSTIHLDHTDDRTGYLGLSHAACNLGAAGRVYAERKRTCPGCMVEFVTRSKGQLHCSRKCYSATRRKKAPRGHGRADLLRSV